MDVHASWTADTTGKALELSSQLAKELSII